jgi:hypothetical protein
MEWLFGLALVPAALCGLVCVGALVLAAVGMRRGSAPGGDEPEREQVVDDEVPVVR